jgi:hypothetical protein
VLPKAALPHDRQQRGFFELREERDLESPKPRLGSRGCTSFCGTAFDLLVLESHRLTKTNVEMNHAGT